MDNLDSLLTGYIACALWSSLDDDGDALDAKYDQSDIAPETIERMRADCFIFADSGLYETYSQKTDSPDPDEYAGHNLWLTRNGHGAGFWDGRYEEPAGRILTDRAKAMGEYSLYVGDDGKIYGAEG